MKKLFTLTLSALLSVALFAQPVSQMKEVTSTSGDSYIPILDNATQLNRKIKMSNAAMVVSGTYLIQGANTYTANTSIANTGTFGITSTGLFTIGSTSVSISGANLKLAGLSGLGSGKFLTTDASGNTSWGTVTAGWGLSGNYATTASNFLGTTDNKSLRFRTNNIQRVIFDSLGRMEIVIDNNLQEPTINVRNTNTGTSAVSAINLDNGTQEASFLMTGTGFADYPNTFVLTTGATGGIFIEDTSAANILFATNNSDRMIIDSIGNIGIGTTAPTAKLHAVSTSSVTSVFITDARSE